MLEQQRIEYLQAMGIQLWMPRQALDNAAESSWLADSLVEHTQIEAGISVQAGHAADLLADMGMADDAKKIVSAQVDVGVAVTQHVIQAETLDPVSTESSIIEDLPLADLTVPKFELHFALWPCGILWVAGQAFEQIDHSFQAAVSYSLLGNAVPQASYSQFKWPYIEGSDEDQGMSVALRALTAQWEFMSSQGARGWVALDSGSLQWLEKVTSKALFSVTERRDIYTITAKKQLWLALQALPQTTVS